MGLKTISFLDVIHHIVPQTTEYTRTWVYYLGSGTTWCTLLFKQCCLTVYGWNVKSLVLGSGLWLVGLKENRSRFIERTDSEGGVGKEEGQSCTSFKILITYFTGELEMIRFEMQNGGDQTSFSMIYPQGV